MNFRDACQGGFRIETCIINNFMVLFNRDFPLAHRLDVRSG
ncbi:hypothetical protein IFHNHDMJ_01936 [Synechococcus sp. CBW1107]|nr:hypothetical protein IFHNHDMJ_01936 [Synechococcus sp. CBW1107]